MGKYTAKIIWPDGLDAGAWIGVGERKTLAGITKLVNESKADRRSFCEEFYIQVGETLCWLIDYGRYVVTYEKE